jgi:hypothetical protein
MLLTHTAGFAYPMSDTRIKTWAIKGEHVVFEPGTGWVYSVIISALSSQTWPANKDFSNRQGLITPAF